MMIPKSDADRIAVEVPYVGGAAAAADLYVGCGCGKGALHCILLFL
jgi:hypothetical protein